MRKKRAFAFHSRLDPQCFAARMQEEAREADLQIEQSENGFSLRIDGNHGGQVFYRARISADENGGSAIEGEIITVPWSDVKVKTRIQRAKETAAYIIGGIVLLPVILIIFLIFGVIEAFALLKNKGKREKREMPRDEENLLDFMLNKLCCTQIVG